MYWQNGSHFNATSVLCIVNFLYPSQILFYRKYISTDFVHFKVENEILDLGCYGVFCSTWWDDQNKLSDETFEQIWKYIYKKKTWK